jgi:hypothetical protein
MLKAEEKSMEPLESPNQELVAFHPEGWDRIPLLPFLQICSHLSHQEVFGILTKVCQHFNLLIKHHQVPVDHVSLVKNSSMAVLLMLLKRVTECKRLSISLTCREHPALWLNTLEELLIKLQRSVKEFHCITNDQPLVTDFINGCRRLEKLNLSVHKQQLKWDWNLHTGNPTLKSLTLEEHGMPADSIEQIFMLFTDLQYLDLQDEWPMIFQDDKTILKPRILSRLKFFKGNDVPMSKTILQVEEITINVKLLHTIRRMSRIIPAMNNLQRIVIRVSSYIFERMMDPLSPHSYTSGSRRLFNAIAENPSVLELEVKKISERENHTREKFDDHIMRLMMRLPESVVKLRYKNIPIRGT